LLEIAETYYFWIFSHLRCIFSTLWWRHWKTVCIFSSYFFAKFQCHSYNRKKN